MSRDEYVEAIERALEPIAMKHNMEITVGDKTVTARLTISRVEYTTASDIASGTPDQASIDSIVSHISTWANALKAASGQ